ncbi:TPA: prepilin peptidase, partial [Streptococcus pneumoniae]|nr:prepilin peptidase [Streptococcus pneumoniae]
FRNRSVIFQIQFTIKLAFLLQKKKERLPFVPFLLLATCLIIFGKLLLV